MCDNKSYDVRNQDVGLTINRMSNLIRRKIDVMVESGMTCDLTGKQNAILGYIFNESQKKDVFQKDIERIFEIRGSSATNMMKILEDKGYIKRVPVDHDARLKKLLATEKAKKQQDEVRRFLDKFSAGLKEGIEQKDLDTFYRVMEQVKGNLMNL
jgi:DNA-binding MarR family transcriptional regulator